jgi:hypothetical protein
LPGLLAHRKIETQKWRSMTISVKADRLKEILRDAREQVASIAICIAGKWSDEYFYIQEINDVITERGAVTIMVLQSVKDWTCTLVDISIISAVKFNKYIMVKGLLTSEVDVGNRTIVPHHVFEYF